MGNRSLGIGFGRNNHFYISQGESYRILMNGAALPEMIKDAFRNAFQNEALDTLRMSERLKVVLRDTVREEDLDSVVTNTLALIIPDLLVDANVTRLIKHLMPKVMQDLELKTILANSLSSLFKFEEGELYFSVGRNRNGLVYRSIHDFNYDSMMNNQNELLHQQAQMSFRFLKSLIVSKYIKDFGLSPHINSLEGAGCEKELYEWKNAILKEQLEVISSDLRDEKSSINPKITLNDYDVYAFLIPVLMDRLSDSDLKKAARLMDAHLAISDFKAVAVRGYDQPNLSLPPQTTKVSNANKRSLQFFAESSTNHGLKFRDKMYRFQHTHIHFENDGEEKEFIVRDADGNSLPFAGEVHSVFEYSPPEKSTKFHQKKRLIAVHYPLKIEEQGHNSKVQILLEDIERNYSKWQKALSEWSEHSNQPKPRLNLTNLLDFGSVFLEALNEQSEQNALLHYSWASLRSDTHAFQSGLRFIVSLKPVIVSESQYTKLKSIFGEMRTDITEEEILDPIDRKAGYRKERVELSNELAEMITSNSKYEWRIDHKHNGQ